MTAYRRAQYPPVGRAESDARAANHDRLHSGYERTTQCEIEVSGWVWRIEHLPDLNRIQLVFRRPGSKPWSWEFRRGMNVENRKWYESADQALENAVERMIAIMGEQNDIAMAITGGELLTSS